LQSLETHMPVGGSRLQWCFELSIGDEAKGLDKYAGVGGDSTNVITAETCLLSAVDPPLACLHKIHSFQIERQRDGPIDNQSGDSRFVKSSSAALIRAIQANLASATVSLGDCPKLG
jgi:hypothetical protein